MVGPRARPDLNGPLRVLHVDTGRTWRGGQRQALLLARALADRGHASLCAFQAGAPLAREAGAAGLELVTFACRGEWDLRAALHLRGIVRQWRPHLLHAHDGHAVTMALLAAAGLAPVVASRRTAFRTRRHPVNRLKLRSVRRWIAISRAARRGLLRAGVDPARVDIVPSGVPLEIPARSTARAPAPGLRAALGLPADSFVILTAGRLEALKGQRTVVEACAFAGDLGNTRWVVAGEGPDQAFLERLARSLGVAERVIFAGPLPDLPGRMQDSQVFVLASFQEGLGSALLDALAAGVPAIVAEGSGAAEVVTEGVEGFLTPVGDARSVAEAVRVLYLDPSRRKQLGSQARLRAHAFSLGATVERTLASYRATLDASAPSARPDA